MDQALVVGCRKQFFRQIRTVKRIIEGSFIALYIAACVRVMSIDEIHSIIRNAFRSNNYQKHYICARFALSLIFAGRREDAMSILKRIEWIHFTYMSDITQKSQRIISRTIYRMYPADYELWKMIVDKCCIEKLYSYCVIFDVKNTRYYRAIHAINNAEKSHHITYALQWAFSRSIKNGKYIVSRILSLFGGVLSLYALNTLMFKIDQIKEYWNIWKKHKCFARKLILRIVQYNLSYMIDELNACGMIDKRWFPSWTAFSCNKRIAKSCIRAGVMMKSHMFNDILESGNKVAINEFIRRRIPITCKKYNKTINHNNIFTVFELVRNGSIIFDEVWTTYKACSLFDDKIGHHFNYDWDRQTMYEKWERWTRVTQTYTPKLSDVCVTFV